MKFYVIIFYFLFSFCQSYSQNYTEKYNSIKERYEYFDENGNLKAYKIWDSLKQQWEYYSLENTTNSNGSKYGSYQSPVDLNLVNKVLSSRQNSYNVNYNLTVNQYRKYKASLFNYFGYSQDKRDYALKCFSTYLNVIEKEKINYSSNSQTRNLLIAMDSWYYECIKYTENQ